MLDFICALMIGLLCLVVEKLEEQGKHFLMWARLRSKSKIATFFVFRPVLRPNVVYVYFRVVFKLCLKSVIDHVTMLVMARISQPLRSKSKIATSFCLQASAKAKCSLCLFQSSVQTLFEVSYRPCNHAGYGTCLSATDIDRTTRPTTLWT